MENSGTGDIKCVYTGQSPFDEKMVWYCRKNMMWKNRSKEKKISDYLKKVTFIIYLKRRLRSLYC